MVGIEQFQSFLHLFQSDSRTAFVGGAFREVAVPYDAADGIFLFGNSYVNEALREFGIS